AQKHAARFCSRRSSRKLLGRHRCRFSTVLPRSHQADQPVAVQPIRKIPQIKVELRKSGTKESRGLIKFLPRRTYENYLLDAEGITAVLNKLPTFRETVIESTTVHKWLSET